MCFNSCRFVRSVRAGRLNLDLIFSLCALFISAIAAAASIYQLHMASSSIAAQTWPYVTIGWSYGNDQSGLVVDNDGLGPAIIRDVILKIDGHPQHDAVQAVSRLIDASESKGQIQMDALVPGVVIRSGNSAKLFSVIGAKWDTQLRSAQTRIELDVCYCSVLNRCWISSIQSLAQNVPGCPQQSAASLNLPALENMAPPAS